MAAVSEADSVTSIIKQHGELMIIMYDSQILLM